MLFPLFNNSYTFSLINQTGQNLTGNYQKLFFNNISFLDNKNIKNITIFDDDLGFSNCNFDGTTFQLFDKVKDTPKAYLYLVNKKNQIILNRFPLALLKKANLSDISKQYQFDLNNIDWLRSYVIKSDILLFWNNNSGFLITVYY